MKWIILKNNLFSSCNVGLDLTKKISDHAIFENFNNIENVKSVMHKYVIF